MKCMFFCAASIPNDSAWASMSQFDLTLGSTIFSPTQDQKASSLRHLYGISKHLIATHKIRSLSLLKPKNAFSFLLAMLIILIIFTLAFICPIQAGWAHILTHNISLTFCFTFKLVLGEYSIIPPTCTTGSCVYCDGAVFCVGTVCFGK